ncbi:FxsA family protein [Salinispira pacifica]|uniref:FxsA protein n=1 Tax=Salinispira pacifica TaxID=1307761 RepID=V5WD52_9SPIO|nr:FxsA family protein [Salinispira pacifica]AHC13505.1 hypothetical protein L21SP2_0059 [Salinispira pacifica]
MKPLFSFLYGTLEFKGLSSFINRLMLLGLMFLVDGYTLLQCASVMGGVSSLTLTVSAALLGALIGGSSYHRYSIKLRSKISAGIYPRREFIHISALLPGLVLMALPGLGSSCIGFLLYIPPFRTAAGKIIYRRWESGFQDLYSFQRASED